MNDFDIFTKKLDKLETNLKKLTKNMNLIISTIEKRKVMK